MADSRRSNEDVSLRQCKVGGEKNVYADQSAFPRSAIISTRFRIGRVGKIHSRKDSPLNEKLAVSDALPKTAPSSLVTVR